MLLVFDFHEQYVFPCIVPYVCQGSALHIFLVEYVWSTVCIGGTYGQKIFQLQGKFIRSALSVEHIEIGVVYIFPLCRLDTGPCRHVEV